jgi:hypothetical protein
MTDVEADVLGGRGTSAPDIGNGAERSVRPKRPKATPPAGQIALPNYVNS